MKKKIFILFLFITLWLSGCGRLSDGEYSASVILTGGSGRAYIESPCTVTIKDGKASAHIFWSSPNYDYMVVDGNTYYPVNTEGNSEFEFPIVLDKDMNVQADTTAMSTPHLIDYSIRFSISENFVADTGDTSQVNTDFSEADREEALKVPEITGLNYVSSDELSFAQCFAIHRYSEDYAALCVDDGRKYLIIPEGKNVPDNLGSDIIPLQRPLNRIYLAASSVMCHFDDIGAIENIRLSGTQENSWYIENAKLAMEEGKLLYGGKYSAPDYEKMVMEDINLAIESTMILHAPKVQKKLEEIGIPVFIDRSSYEKEPLGRCEWIKVYGLLTGKEDVAKNAFDKQEKLVASLEGKEVTGKSIVIFSVNSNHQIVTKKKNDYFAKMVEMAGGTYISPLREDDEKSNSQVTISLEAFFDYAKDADILIYNSTIENPPKSQEELLRVSKTFESFKAFQNGDIWYTDKSLYQYADETGTIIDNLYKIISENEEETSFFHKLK